MVSKRVNFCPNSLGPTAFVWPRKSVVEEFGVKRLFFLLMFTIIPQLDSKWKQSQGHNTSKFSGRVTRKRVTNPCQRQVPAKRGTQPWGRKPFIKAPRVLAPVHVKSVSNHVTYRNNQQAYSQELSWGLLWWGLKCVLGLVAWHDSFVPFELSLLPGNYC